MKLVQMVVSSVTLDGVTYLNKVSYFVCLRLHVKCVLSRVLLGSDLFLPHSRTLQVIL